MQRAKQQHPFWPWSQGGDCVFWVGRMKRNPLFLDCSGFREPAYNSWDTEITCIMKLCMGENKSGEVWALDKIDLRGDAV